MSPLPAGRAKRDAGWLSNTYGVFGFFCVTLCCLSICLSICNFVCLFVLFVCSNASLRASAAETQHGLVMRCVDAAAAHMHHGASACCLIPPQDYHAKCQKAAVAHM